MKKNKTIMLNAISVALFSLMLISGCKKEENMATCTDGIMNGTETGVDCGGSCSACSTAISTKVKSVTYVASGDVVHYTYDSLGRIVLEQTVTNGNNVCRVTYNYTSTTVTELRYDSAASSPNATYVYNLNSDSLAVSWGNRTYIYNGDKQLISIESQMTGVTDFVYSGGNMISSDHGVMTYTYLMDKLEYRDYGLGFKGKGSKNLLSTKTFAGSSTTTTHTYEFDLHGRVTKEYRKFASSLPTEIAFTYY